MIHAPSTASVDREAVKRHGMPVFFELWMRQKYGRSFVPSQHFRLICDHLEALMCGEILTLLVSAPPGTGKSEPISRVFPAYQWAMDPTHAFMRAGYDLGNQRQLNGDTKDICMTDWFKDRWGDLILRYNDVGRPTGLEEYWTTFGGFSKVSSIKGGSLTGRHAQTFIIDDPLKGQDASAEDPAIMRAARSFFQNVAITRVKIGSAQRMIVAAQRFHSLDLNGMILEQYGALDEPTFAHVCLPWHYEPTRACVTPWGRDRRTVKGEELFANPGTRAAVKRVLLAGEDNEVYRAQYQQDPSSGASDYFPEDTFLDMVGAPAFEDTLSCIVVDPTFDAGKRSDFMAIDVWGYRNGHFYCYYSEWVKRDFLDALNAIRSVREKWPVHSIVVERTASGPALLAMLEREGVPGIVCGAEGKPGVTPAEIASKGGTNDQSKQGRARAASFYFRCKRVHFDHSADWFKEKRRWMIGFPHGTHDDMVDTPVMAILWLESQYGGGRVFSQTWGVERNTFGEDPPKPEGPPPGSLAAQMREFATGRPSPVAEAQAHGLTWGMLGVFDEAAL